MGHWQQGLNQIWRPIACQYSAIELLLEQNNNVPRDNLISSGNGNYAVIGVLRDLACEKMRRYGCVTSVRNHQLNKIKTGVYYCESASGFSYLKSLMGQMNKQMVKQLGKHPVLCYSQILSLLLLITTYFSM